MVLSVIKKELKNLANPQRARILSGFFKTKRGEYGVGDIFLGITGPKQRIVAKKHLDASLNELQFLLLSKIHEYRQTALFILVEKYKKSSDAGKKKIIDFYLKNTKHINNWDLVDLSCYKIIGDYFLEKDKTVFYKLAKSRSLWEKRIAIISTYAFIRNNKFNDTLKIAKILLNDKHDLIHKAVGWMLREVGKRDRVVEEIFLKKYYKSMPRTMLRYAIEKFPEFKRQAYLKSKV